MPISKTTEQAKDDRRWNVVRSRATGHPVQNDHAFVYAVQTTGIYCRPGCPSRIPKRSNTRFFDSATAAEAAGFRACRRCRPNQEGLASRVDRAVVTACRMIENSHGHIQLDELATECNYSPSHLQRVFQQRVGVSPKAYATMVRSQRARESLSGSKRVTDAILDAGYEEASRFYRESKDMLGMNPKTFAKGGLKTVIHATVTSCSLGAILVAATEQGLCHVQMGDSMEELAEDLRKRFPDATMQASQCFESQVQSVVDAVEARSIPNDLPLDIRGTAFQKQVWDELRRIPRGQTITYSELAERIGKPRATRAVASACGANQIAVVIPCHRVVRRDGGLGGYRWGLEKKRELLRRESESTGPDEGQQQ